MQSLHSLLLVLLLLRCVLLPAVIGRAHVMKFNFCKYFQSFPQLCTLHFSVNTLLHFLHLNCPILSYSPASPAPTLKILTHRQMNASISVF